MSIPAFIDTHRTDLARMLAGLFSLLGLNGGGLPERIALALHRAVTRVLSPAESATRRLIVCLAHRMKPLMKAEPPTRPLPAGLVRTGAGHATPRFQLFDQRPLLLTKRRPAKAPPVQARISIFTDGAYRTLSLAPPPPPPGDGLQNAGPLVRRLQALKVALDDLPHQARRLLRALAGPRKFRRPQLMGPLRPGRPPGYRQRARHPVDSILHESERLAREALFNTS